MELFIRKEILPDCFSNSDKCLVKKLHDLVKDTELANPNKIVGFKDVNSIHMFCSSAYARLVGLTRKEDITGLRDHELPCEIFQFGDEYRKQDLEIIKKTRLHGYCCEHFVEANNFATHKGYLKFTKYGVINPETQHIVAIGYEADSLFMFNPAKQLLEDFNVKFSQKKKIKLIDNANLSEMEKLVIFWFLQHNQSDQDIAQIITTILKKDRPMSQRTVQTHINNVRIKFGVQNRQELYDLLIELGYDKYIPESIFLKQTTSIRKYQTAPLPLSA